jgi:sortase A
MRLPLTRESRVQIARWTPRVLFAAGALLLGYVGFVLLDSWRFQRLERRSLEEVRIEVQAEPVKLHAPVPGGLFGQLEVPRLGISVMVMEGTTHATLRRAAGHISGTAMPGELGGNIGITAHRDTFFRPLRGVQPGDVILLTNSVGEYRYRVVSTKIVKPSAVEVLDSGGGEVLTLVTCHPFYFVGSAPNRFIVRAERVVGHSGHEWPK